MNGNELEVAVREDREAFTPEEAATLRDLNRRMRERYHETGRGAWDYLDVMRELIADRRAGL